MSGPLDLSMGAIATAGALLLINGVLSVALRLGMEQRILIAAIRCVVQLLLLGYVLVPVFHWAHPGLVLGIGVFMVTLAAREAVARTSRRYGGMTANTLLALIVGAGIATGVGTVLVIKVEPWWDPQYFIPLLGMILGNALTGISLGLDRCLTHLDEGADRIEALLSMGASRWEAARPVASEAARTALIPITNTMSVVGLVSIPGMMTGQILGGTPPELAARYQIVILFLIAAATALSAVGAILLAIRALFDDQHRLRTDRIALRKGKGS